MDEFNSESQLLDPLVNFLKRARRVDSRTIFGKEIAWYGRRIDFATMTITRRTTSYELKLTDNFRAVEQAAYNKLAFDKSYVVTATPPSKNVAMFAAETGVGIILISGERVRVVRSARSTPAEPTLRKKLIGHMRKHGKQADHVRG